MTCIVYAGLLSVAEGDILVVTRGGVTTRLRVTGVEREPGGQAWAITTELAGDET